jgi:hypothetical protein
VSEVREVSLELRNEGLVIILRHFTAFVFINKMSTWIEGINTLVAFHTDEDVVYGVDYEALCIEERRGDRIYGKYQREYEVDKV